MANLGLQNISDFSDYPDPPEDIFTSVYIDWTTQFTRTIDSIEPQEEQIIENQVPLIVPSKRTKPRKSLSEIATLSLFFTKRKHPKKEYLRCKVIRGHKRALRQAFANKIPIATIHKVNILEKSEREAWVKFKDHANLNKNQLFSRSKTENGPITDGVSKRNQQEIISSSIQKSFNDSFCRYYFTQVIIDSFKLYIDVVFATFEAKNLEKRFEMKCCEENEEKVHDSECIEKWETLKKYLIEDMLVDLGITQIRSFETNEFEVGPDDF